MILRCLSDLTERNIPYTSPNNKEGKKVTLKVFWKTTKLWSDIDIKDYHNSVFGIIKKMLEEKYWDKQGLVRVNQLTCEDFAIRVLCLYAAQKGLPIKLKTRERVFRNMEMYNSELHDRYSSNKYGFSEMVMLSYGAADMQRQNENTVSIKDASNLLPGDILAQTYDSVRNVAHHIQVVCLTRAQEIHIAQGNSTGVIVRPFTTLMRLIGKNRADPQSDAYAGSPIEFGVYQWLGNGWDYTNLKTNKTHKNFLNKFQLLRWNFLEFNR